MTEQVFVARKQELARLRTFLDRALAGQGQVCFITGEAGAGKTALVTEFARRAQAQHEDLLVAIGDCNAQTGIGDPYLPFREILAQLTGDVESGTFTEENANRLQHFLRVSGKAVVELGPDLIDIFVPGGGLVTRAAAMVAGRVGWLDQLQKQAESDAAQLDDADLDQSHIFEQYASVLRALAVQQPLILVLDDLQWADADSISLLFHLGRRLSDSRILLVGVYRPDEVALGRHNERHPLEKVLAEFKRYRGDISIDLAESLEAEGRQFVDAFLDAEPNRLDEDFRQALYQHTKGHPLFTVELLRAMQERGDLVQDAEGRWIEGSTLRWEELPARVEGVIEERIGRLEEALRETLTVASVEGEDFTAQVVAHVRQVSERGLVRQLSRELEKKHRIVGEQGRQQIGKQRLYRYGFRHNLFQRHLYNELGEIERELLHEDVGRALEDLYDERTEEIAPQLAWHFATANLPEKAVPYLLQAGDQSRLRYAYQEAVEHYQRALDFMEELGEYETAARTWMKLGLTHHLAFDFDTARQAYEEGFALWQRAGETQPAVAPPPAPHPLRLQWFEPTTLDPALNRDSDTAGVIDQLFSGLVALSPDMDVMPDVARSWEVLEGGRKYVFHLRDDARWSDGGPVTAADFEYAWKRVLDPTTGAPAAALLYDVKGAGAFHAGETSDPNSVGVYAPDDVTLVVELEEPTGYFLHLLTSYTTYPVPRYVVEERGESWTNTGSIVTNGPFRLASWEAGETLTLARNPEYHGRFTGNVERVELSLLRARGTDLEPYAAGNLDFFNLLWHPDPAERDRGRRHYADEYVSAPWLLTWYLGLNVRRPPFDDVRVRRAFALATDRETLANVVRQGLSFLATGGFIPPGMPGHSEGIGLAYDPEEARRLLAEAGYPEGRGFPEVEALEAGARSAQAEFLEPHWQEILGIEIKWQVAEGKTFLARLQQAPPALFALAEVADYPDPDAFLRISLARQFAGWDNERYVTLVERARSVTDQAERMRLYAAADQILVEEAAIVPLGYGRLHFLVKPWVTKYPTSARKWWFWKDVIIEPH